jgi:DNA-binding helix-hairpin-helix protein with protein kinase domain
MFRQAFEDGAVDPGARPTAAQWHAALDGLAGQLRQCAADRAHFFPGSHDTCPWCRYAPPPARRPASNPIEVSAIRMPLMRKT